jgi:lipopolysaccharide/colanic/teichoic acid biosynthesis glycosyltransferase
MKGLIRNEKIRLILGDLCILVISLFLALYLRGFVWPDMVLIKEHINTFIPVFGLSILVYFISGLYDHLILFQKGKVLKGVVISQVANFWITVAYFYFIAPFLNIAPKTNLLIFSIVATILLVVWRIYLDGFISERKQDSAILLADGSEADELFNEINANKRFPFFFKNRFDINDPKASALAIDKIVVDENIKYIVFDSNNQKVGSALPYLYDFLFSRVDFVDANKLYEDMFRRVPLSSIDHAWFLRNISFSKRITYDFVKRLMDISIASLLLIPTILVTPFVYIAIKIEDRGTIFVKQNRVGRGGKNIDIYKFRSMRGDKSDAGKWVEKGDNRITIVGSFLRKSRIDELPQLWNVIKGDLSLIGPRPDIESIGHELLKSIPYYAARYTIKPGLSGWAQTMQGLPPQSLEETKIRLAYDLFYIKQRSLWLDLIIALRTIKTLSSRVGM